MIMGNKMVRGNLDKLPPKDAPSTTTFNIMKEVMKYRKITAHEHVGPGELPLGDQLNIADRLGINKLVVSWPISGLGKETTTPEKFRNCNNTVLKVM